MPGDGVDLEYVTRGDEDGDEEVGMQSRRMGWGMVQSERGRSCGDGHWPEDTRLHIFCA